jgi:hypothetical protein
VINQPRPAGIDCVIMLARTPEEVASIRAALEHDRCISDSFIAIICAMAMISGSFRTLKGA